MDRKFNLCWVGPRARGPEVIVLNVYYYHHDVLQIVVFISASHQNGKFIHLSDKLFTANISERQALIQIINNKIYHSASSTDRARPASVKCQELPANKAKFSMWTKQGNEPRGAGRVRGVKTSSLHCLKCLVTRLAVVVSTEDCCEDPHELWGIFFPVHPVATGMRIVTEITEMIYNSAERSRAPEVPRVLF